MKRVISRLMPTAALLLIACGSERPTWTPETHLSEAQEAAAAAYKAGKVSVHLTLPDLSVDERLAAGVSAYYLGVLGAGEACPDSEQHEVSGAYEAKKQVFFELSPTCDYKLLLKLGPLTKPALTGEVTYKNSIQPIIEKNCVSCHEEYLDSEMVKTRAADIVAAVEGGRMPQNAPLAPGDVARFLAWADGGYIESVPEVEPTVAEQQLAAVYYQNDNGDQLMGYEIKGRKTFEIRRSLWVQPAGVEAGMSVKQLLTFDLETLQEVSKPKP